jgi:phage terminase small subunit
MGKGPTHQDPDDNPRFRMFAHEYFRTGNAPAAAKKIGMHPASGTRFLKDPRVQAQLVPLREKVMNELSYTLKSAMIEAQEAIDFAMKTDNANAYVKAVELRAKLNGLLVDKLDIKSQTAFYIQFKGIGGQPSLPPPNEPKLLNPPEDDPFSDDDDPFS